MKETETEGELQPCLLVSSGLKETETEGWQRLAGHSASLKSQAIGLDRDSVSNRNKNKVECNSVGNPAFTSSLCT